MHGGCAYSGACRRTNHRGGMGRLMYTWASREEVPAADQTPRACARAVCGGCPARRGDLSFPGGPPRPGRTGPRRTQWNSFRGREPRPSGPCTIFPVGQGQSRARGSRAGSGLRVCGAGGGGAPHSVERAGCRRHHLPGRGQKAVTAADQGGQLTQQEVTHLKSPAPRNARPWSGGISPLEDKSRALVRPPNPVTP